MDDIRSQLYRKYVSHFKTEELHRDARWLQAYWSWCDHKYLPFLTTVPADQPVLELGCGPGYILEFLRNRTYTRVEGIDISEEQIALARQRGNNASVADAFKFLRSKKGRYAAILAIDFVEHFTKSELLVLFPLIFKALSPGGVLLLQTPNGQGLFPGQVIYGDLTHLTIFAQDSLKHILSLAGFRTIRFAETGPAPDSFEGRLRTVLWKTIRAVIRIIRQIEAKNSSKLWTESFICAAEK
ncbi:MAG: class I SAM-dependent methyltransferase [Bacteroidota bacterium]